MLQLKTIHKDTLSLFKDISGISDFDFFALAGGTSLSLQLGHRILIDFFTTEKFNVDNLIIKLKNYFEIRNISSNMNSLSLFIKYNSQL